MNFRLLIGFRDLISKVCHSSVEIWFEVQISSMKKNLMTRNPLWQNLFTLSSRLSLSLILPPPLSISSLFSRHFFHLFVQLFPLLHFHATILCNLNVKCVCVCVCVCVDQNKFDFLSMVYQSIVWSIFWIFFIIFKNLFLKFLIYFPGLTHHPHQLTNLTESTQQLTEFNLIIINYA